jgi:hypothetical protein
MLGSIIGAIFFGLVISFVVVGLAWLIGWGKSPKWRPRFGWIAFAFAGFINFITAIGQPVEESKYQVLAGIILLIIGFLIMNKQRTSNKSDKKIA